MYRYIQQLFYRKQPPNSTIHHQLILTVLLFLIYSFGESRKPPEYLGQLQLGSVMLETQKSTQAIES